MSSCSDRAHDTIDTGRCAEQFASTFMFCIAASESSSMPRPRVDCRSPQSASACARHAPDSDCMLARVPDAASCASCVVAWGESMVCMAAARASRCAVRALVRPPPAILRCKSANAFSALSTDEAQTVSRGRSCTILPLIPSRAACMHRTSTNHAMGDTSM